VRCAWLTSYCRFAAFGIGTVAHVLCTLSRTITIADLLQDLKRVSSKWIKTQDESLSLFQWQQGYGAFSISTNQIPRVKTYINNQQEHHRKIVFQENFCGYWKSMAWNMIRVIFGIEQYLSLKVLSYHHISTGTITWRAAKCVSNSSSGAGA
jgi:hypothetical protein